MGAYVRPPSLEEALDALALKPLTVLAGGTDFYPARVGRAVSEDILDITALDDLRGILDIGKAWRIGALTTWTDVLRARLPRCFDGLKLAAREVGGVQIQNMGTVAGNLCNASPAADGVPPLLTLDAGVELASARGKREMPLAEFILGNRKTGRAADELVTAILIPKPPEDLTSLSHFLKLGPRKYLVISIAMVGVRLDIDERRVIRNSALAVGACSAVAQRLPSAENALIGLDITPGFADALKEDHLAALTPIDDVRGSADYRNEVALELVRRTAEAVGGLA